MTFSAKARHARALAASRISSGPRSIGQRMKEYFAERRYVLRMVAQQLRSDIDNGSEWISQHASTMDPVSEPVVRRRLKAIQALIKELERRGAEEDE